MTHSRKRIRKLSTAVFRGARSEYSFDVYPITTSITDNPAIYIFSRRTIDKLGRAHHAVSCVGETGSIVSEIKKHKRARCLKVSEANVICVLKEADSGTRSGVLEDISTARAFCCIQGKFKPAIKAKSSSFKNTEGAKILGFKPALRIKADDIVSTSGATRTGGKQTRKRSMVDEVANSKQPSLDSDGVQLRRSKRKTQIARTVKTRIADGRGYRKKLAA
jgi:hypothetical protein